MRSPDIDSDEENFHHLYSNDRMSSGYSTQSPQTSFENLNDNDDGECSSKCGSIDSFLDDDHCFAPIIPQNEIEPYKEWYDRLIEMRYEYKNNKRGAFPPYPPPPMPSRLIAASEAKCINRFKIKRDIQSYDDYIKKKEIEEISCRFHPTDFIPLPPPHVFIAIIKTLAPHEYVDLTFALAGSVILQLGLTIPRTYPPLPPVIEPFAKFCIKEEENYTTSIASSDSEYTEDSDDARLIIKTVKKVRRLEMHCKEKPKRKVTPIIDDEPGDEDINYKKRTLNRFILKTHRNNQNNIPKSKIILLHNPRSHFVQPRPIIRYERNRYASRSKTRNSSLLTEKCKTNIAPITFVHVPFQCLIPLSYIINFHRIITGH